MACFIYPAFPGLEYKGNWVQNCPVNLDLVIMIQKGKRNSYLDEKGKPTIEFIWAGSPIAWIFPDEATREEELRLISLRADP